MRYRVKLWYADGHLGEHEIEADDAEHAEARAWAMARRRGWLTLPMAYQRADVTEIGDGQ